MSQLESFQSLLEKYQGTAWDGKSELWVDPLGNEVNTSDCELKFESQAISYSWSYEDKSQNGSLKPNDDIVSWQDSWHQPEAINCKIIEDKWGIITIEYNYPAPPGPDWGWRIKLSQRPDDKLVLQMTNIAPWGEEGRAVRMVFQKGN